jgi:hypothetical protein
MPNSLISKLESMMNFQASCKLLIKSAKLPNDNNYRNPSLRFATKAKACKGAGQEEARESLLMLLGV